jgi:hypothetical protein
LRRSGPRVAPAWNWCRIRALAARVSTLIASLALAALLSTCGGGGGGTSGGGSPPPPPPPPATPSPLVVSTASLPDAYLNENYSQQLQASGGTPPYTWNLTALSNPLPAGMAVTGNGMLTGAPSQLFTSLDVTFVVRDSASQSATKTINLKVIVRLAIQPATFSPQGIVSRDFNYQFLASGGTGTYSYTWSLAAGSGPLPPGLTFTSANGYGNLQGKFTTAGTYPFTLEVRDQATQVARQSYTISVYTGPLVTDNPLLPPAISGRAYSYTFQATGGAPPYTWDEAYNTHLHVLGFSLSTSGVLSGTTYSYGNTRIPVRVTDSQGIADVLVCDLKLIQQLTLNAFPLPDGRVGFSYSHRLDRQGGQGPFTYALTSSSNPLPPGLSLDPAFGYLSGTPTAEGTFTFSIEVRDSLAQVATADYSLLIRNDVIFHPYFQNFPVGVVNYPYPGHTLTVVGGTPPYTWRISSGNFPPGLTLDPVTGTTQGTPTAPGLYIFEVEAADSGSPTQSARQNFGVQIRPPLSILTGSTLPDGVATSGSYYNVTIQAAGGAPPPYNLRLSAGSLPPGSRIGNLSDSNGNFYVGGILTTAGTYNFTVEITDNNTPPATVSGDYSINVFNLITFTPANGTNLATVLVGQPVSATISASGGLPPYTWNVQNLPVGVSFDPSTGLISGTPTQPSSGNVDVTVTDSANPPQQARSYYGLGAIELLRIRTTQIPLTKVGFPLRFQPMPSGGTCCAYSWSIVSGSLPPGLAVTDPISLQITGTPTTVGSYTFRLRVTDSGIGVLQQTVEADVTWEIVPALASLGRNDSIATATPIGLGMFRASLSPFSDPGSSGPDVDFYKVTGDAGEVLMIRTMAEVFTPPMPTDTVIEILDASGTRLSSCQGISPPPVRFNLPCLNDDNQPGGRDSQIYFKVPGTPGSTFTFYIRVFDWSGSARPDLVYDLVVMRPLQ